MAKLNKKQIEANLRNKLASQNREKIEQLKTEKDKLEKRFNELWREYRELIHERDELQEKVAQYEDWNRRLQEFMDMSEEDRTAYVENLRRTDEFDSILKKFGFFSEMYGNLFM